ncbi:MAG TPA: imidazolonepropionase [Terriglobia bacterium]|nr:imidazolonepropionase [Terriglobia bacterium]
MTRYSSLFFRNADQLLTLAGPPVPRRGKALSQLGIIPQGGVLTQGAGILRVGRTPALEAEARRLKAEAVDCRGSVVMPGFVDSHTHLVFAGSRVGDYEKRLQGKTYEEIARAGGGIRLSAQRVRQASINSLVRQAEGFLRQFAAHGTTTLEVKTGYGLEVAQELKLLEVIRRLRKTSELELVPTLLAAHALPAEYAGRPAAYIETIIRELIPVAGRKKLAEFIDCFCDRGAFSVEHCRRVLRAGKQQGLIPRLHAEQLAHTGACRLAVEFEAASADHLDNVSAADIRALSRSDVVATLLPGANFHLGLKAYPPARTLIEAGSIVALATDFNPGTSPTLNMQFILSLACSALRMTPAEAIAAATINAAYALRRADRLGSIEPRKQADLIVMDVSDYREIPYYFGVNHCRMTVKAGRIEGLSSPSFKARSKP